MKILITGIIVGLAVFLMAMTNALPTQSQQQGIVIDRIVDGDTVRATADNGEKLNIRLASIDAPEKAQPWGKESKANLEKMALNKRGRLQFVETDRYGRTVGMITLDDNSLNINYWMVSTGNAHYYEKYSKWMDKGVRDYFSAAYKQAESGKVGMWKGGKIQLPEEFRKANRQG